MVVYRADGMLLVFCACANNGCSFSKIIGMRLYATPHKVFHPPFTVLLESARLAPALAPSSGTLLVDASAIAEAVSSDFSEKETSMLQCSAW